MKRLLATWNKSLMGRIAGAMFLLAVLAVILVSYVVYDQATRSLTQSVYERLKAVSILKEDDLTRWVDQQRLNLVFLAWQPDVQAKAGVLLGGPASTTNLQAAHEVLLSYLQFVVTSISELDELFIMDLDGRVVISTRGAREGRSHIQDFL